MESGRRAMGRKGICPKRRSTSNSLLVKESSRAHPEQEEQQSWQSINDPLSVFHDYTSGKYSLSRKRDFYHIYNPYCHFSRNRLY